MIQEINIAGVFIHPFMIALFLAFVASRPASNLLHAFGVYKKVWHPGLFDTALFIILFGLFACLLVPDVVFSAFRSLFI